MRVQGPVLRKVFDISKKKKAEILYGLICSKVNKCISVAFENDSHFLLTISFEIPTPTVVGLAVNADYLFVGGKNYETPKDMKINMLDKIIATHFP